MWLRTAPPKLAAGGRGKASGGVPQQFQTIASAKSSSVWNDPGPASNMLQRVVVLLAEEEHQDSRGPRDAGLLPVCCRWLW